MKLVQLDIPISGSKDGEINLQLLDSVEETYIKPIAGFGVDLQLIHYVVLTAANLSKVLPDFLKSYYQRNLGKRIKLKIGDNELEVEGYSIDEVKKIYAFLESKNAE